MEVRPQLLKGILRIHVQLVVESLPHRPPPAAAVTARPPAAAAVHPPHRCFFRILKLLKSRTWLATDEAPQPDLNPASVWRRIRRLVSVILAARQLLATTGFQTRRPQEHYRRCGYGDAHPRVLDARRARSDVLLERIISPHDAVRVYTRARPDALATGSVVPSSPNRRPTAERMSRRTLAHECHTTRHEYIRAQGRTHEPLAALSYPPATVE